MTTLLVVSDDAWGARAEDIAARYKDVLVATDRSGGLGRSLKLVLRGTIPLGAAISMLMSRRSLPARYPTAVRSFQDNAELRSLAEREGTREILLFRAGLIISGKTLENCRVRNIHCADIENFGGLSAIYRALRQKAFAQCATLHVVTNRIDEGDVLDTEPFVLDPSLTYSTNEALAYEAGLRLLQRTLDTDSATGDKH